MDNPVTRSDVPVSQQFGINAADYAWTGQPGHNGLDLAVATGTQLFAPVDGDVIEAGYDPQGWGLYLKLRDAQGGCWLLAHLSDLGATVEGDRVEAGTPVALSGSTGRSTGPHVHVGYRTWCTYRATPYNGWVDPQPLMAVLGGEPV